MIIVINRSDAEQRDALTRKIAAVFLAAALILGMAARLSSPQVTKRTPDEKVYSTYVSEIMQGASAADLLEAYNADSKFSIYPPPTRIGYLYLVASLAGWTGWPAERAGVELSRLFSVMTLFVLAVIGRRFFNPWIAFFAVSLLAALPMDLAIAQRMWQESLLSYLAVLLIYLILAIQKHPQAKSKLLLFSLIATGAMLIKESGIVLSGICFFWLMFVLLKERRFGQCVILIFLCAAGLEMDLFIFKIAMGNLTVVFQTLLRVKEAIHNNNYAVNNQNGSWVDFLRGFWYLSPMSAVLFLVGFMTALVKRNPVMLGLGFFTLAILLLLTGVPYFKNYRYASIFYGSYCLPSGAGLWALVEVVQNRLLDQWKKGAFLAVAIGVLLFSSWMDYQNFRHLFIEVKVPDLIDKNIIKYSIYTRGSANRLQ